MFLLRWYERFLQIRLEAEGLRINLARERVCESCEYLKAEIEKKDQLVKELIDKLTDKPTETISTEQKQEPIVPRFTPWRVRRQMMEAEDRVRAQKMRENQELMQQAGIKQAIPSVAINAQKEVTIAPADDPDVIALEKEMNLIAEQREAKDVSAASGGVKFNAI